VRPSDHTKTLYVFFQGSLCSALGDERCWFDLGRLPSIDPASYKPLREQVFELLRQAILTGNLLPGERLLEPELAEELKVSRTPVREAMHMLEKEGLVVMLPRRGTFVAGITSVEEVVGVFQVRSVLEGLAASLAAEHVSKEQVGILESLSRQIEDCIKSEDLKKAIKLDTQFHHTIYEASQNACLQQIVDNLREQIERFRAASLSREGRMAEALYEHRELAKAIAAGDSEKARELSIKHIRNAQKSIEEVMKGSSPVH